MMKKHWKSRIPKQSLTDGSLSSYKLITPPISTLAQETATQYGMDIKMLPEQKYVLPGHGLHIFNFDLDTPGTLIDKRFKKKPDVAKVNKKFSKQVITLQKLLKLSNPDSKSLTYNFQKKILQHYQ